MGGFGLDIYTDKTIICNCNLDGDVSKRLYGHMGVEYKLYKQNTLINTATEYFTINSWPSSTYDIPLHQFNDVFVRDDDELYFDVTIVDAAIHDTVTATSSIYMGDGTLKDDLS